MIPIYTPYIARNQRNYVLDCIDTNRLTYRGDYVAKFELALNKFLGKGAAVAVSNGTTALYAMYQIAGLRGKVVVTSNLTYAATVSQLLLLDCKVILVDCDEYLQMDINETEYAVRKYKADAIVVPQLYADLPDMQAFRDIARRYNCVLLEDAAESFACSGAGKAGDMASFSFFANKVITCGEGGCVFVPVSSERFYDYWVGVKQFSNQCAGRHYDHLGVGTNFRMTNIQAAIGLAQMEDLPEILEKKRAIAAFYRENLRNDVYYPIKPRIIGDSFDNSLNLAASSEWMPVFQSYQEFDYSSFERHMNARGVEVRPIFKPIHRLRGFESCELATVPRNATDLSKECFNLPSYPNLTTAELDQIVSAVNQYTP